MAYPIMTSFRYVPYVACVALDGKPALGASSIMHKLHSLRFAVGTDSGVDVGKFSTAGCVGSLLSSLPCQAQTPLASIRCKTCPQSLKACNRSATFWHVNLSACCQVCCTTIKSGPRQIEVVELGPLGENFKRMRRSVLAGLFRRFTFEMYTSPGHISEYCTPLFDSL